MIDTIFDWHFLILSSNNSTRRTGILLSAECCYLWGDAGTYGDADARDTRAKQSLAPTETVDTRAEQSPSPTETGDTWAKQSLAPTETGVAAGG